MAICKRCHKWKPKRLYARHSKTCMGGIPIEQLNVGGTGKEVSYKKKQKEKGKKDGQK